jgi:hypothetical protein
MTIGPWAGRLGTELRTWTLAYTGLPDPGRCAVDLPVPSSPAAVSARGGSDRRRLAGPASALARVADGVPGCPGPGRAGVVGMGAAALRPSDGLPAVRGSPTPAIPL